MLRTAGPRSPRLTMTSLEALAPPEADAPGSASAGTAASLAAIGSPVPRRRDSENSAVRIRSRTSKHIGAPTVAAYPPNGVLASGVQQIVDHAHDVELRQPRGRREGHGLRATALKPDRGGERAHQEGRHAQE